MEVGSLRIYYTNINGVNFDPGEHSLLQLCKTLNEKGVDLICLIERNVHWRPHARAIFLQILHQTWQEQKFKLCTSESNLPWNSSSKPGGQQ